MSNLAGLYTTLGNYQRSEQLQRQALDILEKTYGTYHPRVAWAVEKMGGLYAASGDYRQALQRYRQALDITEKTVGPEHPEAANCLDGMGLAYYSLGNFAEAADCYRRALAIREKAFGANSRQGGPQPVLSGQAIPCDRGLWEGGDLVHARPEHLRKSARLRTTPKWPFALTAWPRCAAR